MRQEVKGAKKGCLIQSVTPKGNWSVSPQGKLWESVSTASLRVITMKLGGNWVFTHKLLLTTGGRYFWCLKSVETSDGLHGHKNPWKSHQEKENREEQLEIGW